MATYTTIAGLQKRISSKELAALANDSATPAYTEIDADTLLSSDSDVMANVNQAITDASIRADLILNDKLDLTDSTNQTAVEQFVAYCAVYLLFIRRHNCGDERNPYYQMMRSSERTLKDISKRRLFTQTDSNEPTSMAYTNITSTGGVMTDDALENF